MARELPSNLPAERALLGAVIRDNDLIWKLPERLEKDDWFEPYHGELWLLLRDTIEANRQATIMTLMHDMAQDADIGGIKASDYLRSLVEEAPASLAVPSLARTVKDLGLRRRAIGMAEGLIDEAYRAPASTGARVMAMKFETSFNELFARPSDIGIRHVSDIGKGVIETLSKSLQEEAPAGLSLGIKGAQDLMGAMMGGRLYYLAGPPGSGKSALAQQIGEHVAREQPVFFQSAEMEGEELVERRLARLTGVTADRIERGTVGLNEMEQLVLANNSNYSLKLHIDSSAAPTANRIVASAKRLHKILGGLALVIVDHLLYVRRPEWIRDEMEGIRHNLQTFKQAAKDLGIPFLVLGQLKKEFSTQQTIRRPTVGDLYGGSAVEQDCDVICLIWREEHLMRQREPLDGDPKRAEWDTRLMQVVGKAELVLGKRRGGSGFGVRTLGFDGPRTAFSDEINAVHRAAQDRLLAAVETPEERAHRLRMEQDERDGQRGLAV